MDEIRENFKQALIDIWEEKAIDDFEKSYYYTEDPLKVKLYFNIMQKLKISFFEDNELRLLTEYHIPGIGYADMVLVDISDEKWKILSIIELKNKNLNTRNEEEIKKDYHKMKKYIKLSKEIDLFMVSVNTNVNDSDTGISWGSLFNINLHNKRFVELILDESDNNLHLRTYDWFYKNNTDKLINYIKLKEGLCDDCLSEVSKITPRQQVNLICRKNDELIKRTEATCKHCNESKLVNFVIEY